MSKRLIGSLLLLAAAALAFGFFRSRVGENMEAQAGLLAMPPAAGEFDRVTGPADLMFPRDLGAHPDTQTEWWYYTGNLKGENGERYGFQLTFFRRALVGPDLREERGSGWAMDQVYLAHFALTDAADKQFYAFERLERGAAGLAGGQGEPGFRVWLHDWSVEQTGPGVYRLVAAEEGVRLELVLQERKGLVLQGDRGYSRKGPELGNASMYFSQTRLSASGTLVLDSRQVSVEGLSWMDHEYSTSALSADQIGWDWFSVQLDDGSELMLYTIRRSDGTIDPFSKGTLIAPDGRTQSLTAADFQVEVVDTWRSPISQGKYPAAWVIKVPGEDLTLRIAPILADQELNLSFIYWEGAVDIQGFRGGKSVRGWGYVELTGYAQSLEGRF